MAEEIKSKALQRLVKDLRAAHGGNLASITLYGSTAQDENDDASRHDVLVVLRSTTPEDLRPALEPVRAWTRAGNPMPIYFSTDELQRAGDVFPIEFLQMEQARKIVYGADPFEFVTISDANLRHQTEYELRTKFLRLRRLFLLSANSAEQLKKLMSDSLSSFVALFRAVLLLRGQAPARFKRDVIAETARLLAFDASPFLEILKLREGTGPRLSDTATDDLFTAYLAQLARVIDAVDQMPGD